jgi:hypothetical protein
MLVAPDNITSIFYVIWERNTKAVLVHLSLCMFHLRFYSTEFDESD